MAERDVKQETGLNRRHFFEAAAAAGVVLAACTSQPVEEKPIALGPKMEIGPKKAPDGEPIKAGVIGCGGRGSGAVFNFLDAGPSLQVVALSDVFMDRIDDCRKQLKEQKSIEIPDNMCFAGFDGFRKLLETDINYVIIATPPHFRPAQFQAAVEARKNVFMEKPVAVDPVGARSIMDSAEKANAFGLKVATGTQRRHQRSYIETYNRIMDGAIGELVAARAYWNQSQLWFKERAKGWSDMEWMIRDWVNWAWLSGDHIVEQHIHNLDVINWFSNSHPVKAVGMGGRARRVTGDQYDFFSVDYEMQNGMHMLSMARQIDGCVNNVSEYLVGSKGSTNCKDTIYGPKGDVVWMYNAEPEIPEGAAKTESAAAEPEEDEESPYVQEHIDLVAAIRQNKPLNEANATAVSTLTAVMGRVAAYTGKEVAWDEIMGSTLKLGPETYELGKSPLIKAVVPVPGTEKA